MFLKSHMYIWILLDLNIKYYVKYFMHFFCQNYAKSVILMANEFLNNEPFFCLLT